MKVLLDTNFIVTCVKNKIHFDSLANELIDEEIEWLVPGDVLKELEKLKRKQSTRKEASIGLEILKTLNPKIIDLKGKNPNVDIKIIDYIKGKNIVLATMDKELKKRVKNKILSVRGKSRLEVLE